MTARHKISHRGYHELLADYLNRLAFYDGSNSSRGQHETRPRSLTQTLLWDPLARELETNKQDAHADKVMAEFMGLSTKEIASGVFNSDQT